MLTPFDLPRSWTALIAGVYAWIVTVALPLSHQGSPGAARATAAVALALLVSGAVTSKRFPKLGLVLGVWGFVAGCGVAWGLGRAQLLGYRLDPVQGVLGTIGWGAYVTSWAAPPRAVPAALPGAPARKPRARLASSAIAMGAIGCVAAFAILLVPWWIPERARGVVGQAVALAGAAYVAALAFRVACGWATPTPGDRSHVAQKWRRALARAGRPLALALTIAVLGALIAWLR